MNRTLSLSLSLIIVAGCVDKGPGPKGKKVDVTYVQSHLLAAVPGDIEHFDLPVGDKLVYVGNKVDKTRVAPGQPVTITHYWKVLAPIGDRWFVFGQVRGAPGTADFQNLDPTDMEIGHAPETWQAGEIIEDVQTFTLRPDWRSTEATVLVGLLERGKHGPLDRMAVTGPKTRDRAIVARQLEVDLAHAPAPKGTTYISHAQGPIAIDGIANDLGWAGIQPTTLVTAESSADPIGKATAKLTWDETYLYAFIQVTDSDITTPYDKHDQPLWKGDCVELFIDADGNRRGYIELQVNPNNATFDKWYATTRAAPGDESWDSGMVTAVKLRGSAKAGDSGDQGWDAEIAIPWDAVKGRQANMAVRLPPHVGDRWRLNIVRVDRKTGGKPNAVTASSWNRITMADFHALDRMVVAVFADRTGSIVPHAGPPDDGAGSGAGSGSGSAAGSGGDSSAAGSGSATAAAPLPPIITRALAATRGTVPIELLPSGTRFAATQLTDDQLDELVRLALARSADVAIELGAARTLPRPRVAQVVQRLKSLGVRRMSVRDTSAKPKLSPKVLATIAASPPRLSIEVRLQGARIGTEVLDDDQLFEAMRLAVARNPKIAIGVTPAPNVPPARILQVIDRAKISGIAKVALVPRHPEGGGAGSGSGSGH